MIDQEKIFEELERDLRHLDRNLRFDLKNEIHQVIGAAVRLRLVAVPARFRSAISPDGETAAVGRDDGTVRLYSLREDRQLMVFNCGNAPVASVAFSADGRSVASGGADGGVKLWDTAADRVIAEFNGHESEVGGVAFSDDGQQLASRDSEGCVRVWDVASRTCSKTLRETPRVDVELQVASATEPEYVEISDRNEDKTDTERLNRTSNAKNVPTADLDDEFQDGISSDSSPDILPVTGLAFACYIREAGSVAFRPERELLVTDEHGTAWIKSVPANATLMLYYRPVGYGLSDLVIGKFPFGRTPVGLGMGAPHRGDGSPAPSDDTEGHETIQMPEVEGVRIEISDRGLDGTRITVSADTRPMEGAAIGYQFGPSIIGTILLKKVMPGLWGGYKDLPELRFVDACRCESRFAVIVPPLDVDGRKEE